MRLTVAKVDVLIWTLIYGGLLTLACGLALRTFDSALARIVSVVGVGLAAIGAVLIWVRSRMVARSRSDAASKRADPANPPSPGNTR